MGGDYGGTRGGNAPPTRPPPPSNFACVMQTQGSFSKQKVNYIPILYQKAFIPFHFPAESEEYLHKYAVLA